MYASICAQQYGREVTGGKEVTCAAPKSACKVCLPSDFATCRTAGQIQPNLQPCHCLPCSPYCMISPCKHCLASLLGCADVSRAERIFEGIGQLLDRVIRYSDFDDRNKIIL